MKEKQTFYRPRNLSPSSSLEVILIRDTRSQALALLDGTAPWTKLSLKMGERKPGATESVGTCHVEVGEKITIIININIHSRCKWERLELQGVKALGRTFHLMTGAGDRFKGTTLMVGTNYVMLQNNVTRAYFLF